MNDYMVMAGVIIVHFIQTRMISRCKLTIKWQLIKEMLPLHLWSDWDTCLAQVRRGERRMPKNVFKMLQVGGQCPAYKGDDVSIWRDWRFLEAEYI